MKKTLSIFVIILALALMGASVFAAESSDWKKQIQKDLQMRAQDVEQRIDQSCGTDMTKCSELKKTFVTLPKINEGKTQEGNVSSGALNTTNQLKAEVVPVKKLDKRSEMLQKRATKLQNVSDKLQKKADMKEEKGKVKASEALQKVSDKLEKRGNTVQVKAGQKKAMADLMKSYTDKRKALNEELKASALTEEEKKAKIQALNAEYKKAREDLMAKQKAEMEALKTTAPTTTTTVTQ